MRERKLFYSSMTWSCMEKWRIYKKNSPEPNELSNVIGNKSDVEQPTVFLYNSNGELETFLENL